MTRVRSRDDFPPRELVGIVLAAIVAGEVGAANWQEDGFGVRDGSRIDLGPAAINAAVASPVA